MFLSYCQKGYSSRTRIKTPFRRVFSFENYRVRKVIPVEQGLRPKTNLLPYYQNGICQKGYSSRTRIKTIHSFVCICFLCQPCQKGYSSRTRIKTFIFCNCCQPVQCQKGYSSRTRIKTSIGIPHLCKWIRQKGYSSRTRIKTKYLNISSFFVSQSQKGYSSRTRIKTPGQERFPSPAEVRKVIPVEQGLRHHPNSK